MKTWKISVVVIYVLTSPFQLLLGIAIRASLCTGSEGQGQAELCSETSNLLEYS